MLSSYPSLLMLLLNDLRVVTNTEFTRPITVKTPPTMAHTCSEARPETVSARHPSHRAQQYTLRADCCLHSGGGSAKACHAGEPVTQQQTCTRKCEKGRDTS
jgi:hypothetical protein